MKHFSETIQLKTELFQRTDRVIAALSGGSDSVCLLLALQELAERRGFALSALHVHHGIRGQEADEDEAFVRNLCRQRGILLTVRRVDAPALAAAEGLSLEEAARKLRYGALYEAAEQCREGLPEEARVLIALAHHRDDQAETLLLNLFRGSGTAGLGGMEEISERRPGIFLVRPLLESSHALLQQALREQGQSWREDSTNLDTSYRRNYLRQELLPALEEHFPGALRGILRTAENLRETENYLAAETEALLPQVTEDGSMGLQDRGLRLKPLSALPVLQQKRILQAWLGANGGQKDLGSVHLEAALQLLAGQSGGRLSLPRDRTLVREQERLILRKNAAGAGEVALPKWQMRTFSYEKNSKIPENVYTKWLDYDKIAKYICLRTRREGDYFLLPDGGKKTLHRYFIDKKVPESERDKVPLLAEGSHILWVVGYVLSADVKVQATTTTIAEITVEVQNGKTRCEDHVQ